jgi:heptosyltransferase-2
VLKKILIIRFSSIGDIVLTTPVMRCLKMQMPEAEIHYLTKPNFKIILENNPYLDVLHFLDKHPVLKAVELKNENYDLVIDLHNNLRTAMFKAVLGIQAYSFPKLNIEKFMLVNFKINRLPNIHIVDRYLQTTESLGIKNDGKGLDYFIPKVDILHDFFGFKPTQQKYYTWAIGAQHFTKRLPNHKIISIAKSLPHPVLLLGGKEDQENALIIQHALGEKCINACGQINLNQSASLVQQSLALYTNDTGLMHIAAALKIPVISFWGNTLPAFGMTPYYGGNLVAEQRVENKDISCRPCSKIGFKKCPKGHFKCMEELPINLEKIEDFN